MLCFIFLVGFKIIFQKSLVQKVAMVSPVAGRVVAKTTELQKWVVAQEERHAGAVLHIIYFVLLVILLLLFVLEVAGNNLHYDFLIYIYFLIYSDALQFEISPYWIYYRILVAMVTDALGIKIMDPSLFIVQPFCFYIYISMYKIFLFLIFITVNIVFTFSYI